MSPVSKLDQNHPDVLCHGKDHLPVVFSLTFFMAGKMNLADLGHPIHKLENFFAKQFLDFFWG